MPLNWTTPSGHPFPPSSTRSLAALARGFVTVTRLPMNRPKIVVRMVIPGHEVIHLIGARKPADVTDPSVITEYPLALRVPRFGEADSTIRVRPLTGSHAINLRNRDTGTAHHHRSPRWTGSPC